MIKLNKSRRLKLFLRKYLRIIIFCFAIIMAVLLYSNFFVLDSTSKINTTELTPMLPLSLTIFGVASGLFISLIVLLLDD